MRGGRSQEDSSFSITRGDTSNMPGLKPVHSDAGPFPTSQSGPSKLRSSRFALSPAKSNADLDEGAIEIAVA